jgi:DNA-binding NarL/FixJ family response regulator
MGKIRILIVDDHWTVRAGIRTLLDGQTDIEVVDEAVNGEEAVDKARQLKPELVLMDIAMAGISGIEATRRIKKELPNIIVLVLTMHDDEEFFFPVLRAGASGYVLKEAKPQELLYAIRTVYQGQVFFSPVVAKAVLQGFLEVNASQEDEKYGLLTPREKQVLQLVAQGQTSREISEKLFLSIRTVEKHRQSVFHKLGLDRREDLTKYALRKGLITLEE